MPSLNRRGPQGQGAMSGHAMGICTNFGESMKVSEDKNTEPNDNQKSKLGFGGLGFGKGGKEAGFGRGGRGQGGRGLCNRNRHSSDL
jgi:hypothetical protein